MVTAERLPTSVLRVLGAVLHAERVGVPITLTSIAHYLGWRNINYARICLLRLRDAGLVAFEDGRHHTIKACCRFVTVEELDA